MNLALQAGEREHVPLPVTAAAREAFSAAMEKGLGSQDMCAVIKVLEEATGSEGSRRKITAGQDFFKVLKPVAAQPSEVHEHGKKESHV